MTICRGNIFVLFGSCSLSPESWFRLGKYSLCDSERSFGSLSGADVGGFAMTAATAAVDHKRGSSHCTKSAVSSHHSQRPGGLGCACERGAYFVFLCPDSDPWGTFHPEMCSLLFPAPLYMWALEPSRRTRLENLRVASNESTVPLVVSPLLLQSFQLTRQTQRLVNK